LVSANGDSSLYVSRRLRQVLSFATYAGLVPPPAVFRPSGISALTMARNEEDWVETSVRSILDMVDEVVLADHGSDDDTPEIVRKLAQRYPGKIRLVSLGDIDFSSAINKMLRRTRYRWVLRWHADFIAQTSGPSSVKRLVRLVRSLDRGRYFCISLSGFALDGDLEHQFPDRRDLPEPFLYTYSPWLSYAIRERWESLHVPWFYEKASVVEGYYFHMRTVKSLRRMLQRLYWSFWYEARNKGSSISLREFVEQHAMREWGGATVEEAARNHILAEFARCVPFSPEICGDYPAILKPAIAQPPFRLVFRDGKLVDRVEFGRYRPLSPTGETK